MGTEFHQTNQLYRKEYFIDTRNVLGPQRPVSKILNRTTSLIIDSAKVYVSDQPMMVHGTASDQIRVETIKEDARITCIRIACPCGRKTDMKVHYDK